MGVKGSVSASTCTHKYYTGTYTCTCVRVRMHTHTHTHTHACTYQHNISQKLPIEETCNSVFIITKTTFTTHYNTD